MEKSRTEYSTMNTVVAMISRIAAILMGFVTRVVFTHTLSESYVGINGLFTDILNVLSLTELGVKRRSVMHSIVQSHREISENSRS